MLRTDSGGEAVDGKRPRAAASPIGYRTAKGAVYVSTIEDFLDSAEGRRLRGKVQLVFTSPPFPLNRKKAYGNRDGDEFVAWLSALAPRLAELLKPDGSLVMEMGNAWVQGKPVMSTLSIESLLAFLKEGKLNLCQQFVCHNPARLPSPAQWVNVERVRVKDSFTHVWWMSPTARPKANNREVLTEYSASMRKLLRSGKYNAGKRPSGHNIGDDSFLADNAGAIPSNVLTYSNTSATDAYREYCRSNGYEAHPAPMPPGLVAFFVSMLTDKNDVVLDPFGGSNTTGAVAEELGRKWVTVEPNDEYVEASRGRFPAPVAEDTELTG